MTHPTDEFNAAIESALEEIHIPAYGMMDAPQLAGQAEALASIQVSTGKLLAALVGEDDVPKPEPEDNIAPAGWCGTCDQIFNDEGDCLCVWRNELRQELRQKIDQLIKDLSK